MHDDLGPGFERARLRWELAEPPEDRPEPECPEDVDPEIPMDE